MELSRLVCRALPRYDEGDLAEKDSFGQAGLHFGNARQTHVFETGIDQGLRPGTQPARMLRVGIYARVSTLDQQTLPMQIRALRDYAAKREWAVVSQVKKVGSGVSQREQRQLINAARRRQNDMVLVWRLDRRGHSVGDLVSTLQELTELGVGFVPLTEAAEALDFTNQLAAPWPDCSLCSRPSNATSCASAFAPDSMMPAAWVNGKRLARPPLPAVVAVDARRLFRDGISKPAIARQLGIGRTSVRRLLARKKS